jgi:gas vesicle protein
MNGNPVTSNPANNAMAFLAGAMLGAGVTLLMAPARGSETRRKIGETARRLGKGAANKFGQLKDAVAQSANGELEEATASARSAKRA